MLRHLRVTNFAILSDVAIDFAEGFNALTGETGAGKSLIVEAVNLLRGGRASADIPRAGADEAVVEAIFDLPADIEPVASQILVDAGLPARSLSTWCRRSWESNGFLRNPSAPLSPTSSGSNGSNVPTRRRTGTSGWRRFDSRATSKP